MRNWDEIMDDAETLAKSFVTLKSKTSRDTLIIASEGQHIVQNKTKAVRRDYTVLTSSFDGNGSVAKDRDTGEIVRGYFYPTGSTVPCDAFKIGYSQLIEMRRIGNQTNGIWPLNSNFNKIAFAVYAGRIYFYPQVPQSGSFVFTQIPKLTKFSIDAAAANVGYWAAYGPSDSAFNAAVEANGPEPEFDFAEEGLAFYTAAGLLDKMPAARMAYEGKYQEWMARFASCFEDVIQGDVPYNINQGPHGYTGPASYR
jgi:hypothetical protein